MYHVCAPPSIGDVIAIATKPILIVSHLCTFNPIDLDFLGQVCTQIVDLRPNLPTEVAHIERVRTIALQCLGPLRAFEDKMREFENSLGPNPRSRGLQSSSLRRRDCMAQKAADFKRRLHWSSRDTMWMS
ncbi:hypothetical protein QBC46DRAFT_399815 [Diplogelasinospora grovesii]|uniref:Uncharacterized protein n=1 Tax=Diplogelasinospora grovesii TaxID=303347 RepID=A0AAN6MY85_9PEZI|nr:hypothetical protein QBC46DRAFT_399815 [Diplogelasinospora grovesii]